MELSKRLQAVADLVSEGQIVADVGTDHGYIPIYLLVVLVEADPPPATVLLKFTFHKDTPFSI